MKNLLKRKDLIGNEIKPMVVKIEKRSEGEQKKNTPRIEPSDYDIEKAIHYNFLGVKITNPGDNESKIQVRINKRSRYMWRLIHVIIFKIYKTYIM